MDWEEQVLAAVVQSPEYRLGTQFRNQILGGDRLALENRRDRERNQKYFRRTIIQSARLGEGSAEIVARIQNVTPVDADFDPKLLGRVDKLLFARKADGGEFKYVLEKLADGWRITQVLVSKTIYGEKNTWLPAYDILAIPANVLTLSP